MKILVILTIFGTLFFIPPGIHSQILTATKVTEAEIYSNGYAQIFSRSEIRLRKGIRNVTYIVNGNNIHPQTIAAEILPKGKIVRIGEPGNIDCTEDDSCQYYTEQSKSLNQLIQLKILEIEKLDIYEKILLENARVTHSTGINMNYLRESISYIYKQISEVKDSKTKIQRQIDELNKDHQKITDQLNKRKNYIKTNLQTITVKMEIPFDGLFEIQLSYTTTNLRWNREQEVDIDETTSVAHLRNFATIRTDFLEEWKNVKLTLIDKEFEFRNRPPEINPLRVTFRIQPAYRNQPISVQSQIIKAGAQPRIADENISVDRETVQVQRKSETDADIFILSGTYTLTNENPLRTEIYTDTLMIKLRYILVPYIVNKVQLLGIIHQRLETIHPAPSLVRLNTRPVGINLVPTFYNSDSMAFNLGYLKDVSVVRKRENSFRSRSFFGSNQRDLFEYSIQITNRRTTPIEITVIDRIPVSTDQQIDVKLKDSQNTKPDKNGILIWNLNLPPGQGHTIGFSFEITYPKGTNIFLIDQIE